jgi:phage shock protein PspC (stress-responsive transcriptional regulator)
MYKTISIHLQGTPFQIEEGAYEILRNYLDRLKKVLHNQKGSEEILQDVELRMAELFTKQLLPSKKVIEQPMVEEVLAILGNPEVFGDEDLNAEQESFTQKERSVEKRLFRDEENAILGGVLAGFANYLNWDVTVIRAVYVLLIIFGGFGFPLYIVLWIITPKAKTSFEKLQMKGKPVNLESMKSEIENAADRIQKKSKAWTNKIKEENGLQNSLKKLVRVISVFFGLLSLLLGTAFFITAIVFLFGDPDFIPAQINGEFMSLGDFGTLILESPTDSDYLIWGIVFTASSVIGLLWLTGIRAIFAFKSSIIRYSSFSLIFMMVFGIILLSLTGAKTGRAFAINGEIEKDLFTVDTTVLNLKFDQATGVDKQGYKTISRGDKGVIKVANKRIYLHGIEIEYRKSTDSIFHIKQYFTANGRDHQMAILKAKNIDFKVDLISNTVQANTFYTFPVQDKLRDQKVKLIVEVPQNGKVKVNGKIVYPFLEDELDTKVEENSHAYIQGDGEYDSW